MAHPTETNIAECGARSIFDPKNKCAYLEAYFDEATATHKLMEHLRDVHGADLQKPSTTLFGWVRPHLRAYTVNKGLRDTPV